VEGGKGRKGSLQEEDPRGHSLASTRGHPLICYPVPLLPPQPALFFSSLTMTLVFLVLGEAFLPNLLLGEEDVSLLYLVAIGVTRRLGEGKGRPSLSSSSLGRHGGLSPTPCANARKGRCASLGKTRVTGRNGCKSERENVSSRPRELRALIRGGTQPH